MIVKTGSQSGIGSGLLSGNASQGMPPIVADSDSKSIQFKVRHSEVENVAAMES